MAQPPASAEMMKILSPGLTLALGLRTKSRPLILQACPVVRLLLSGAMTGPTRVGSLSDKAKNTCASVASRGSSRESSAVLARRRAAPNSSTVQVREEVKLGLFFCQRLNAA